MKLVVDTNVLLAVALNQPVKEQLVTATQGAQLVSPSILPYELGNAMSALVKRKGLRRSEALTAWEMVAVVQVELLEVDIGAALELAIESGIYAYDAYFLQCAVQTGCPLLTLDGQMQRVAKDLHLRILEA